MQAQFVVYLVLFLLGPLVWFAGAYIRDRSTKGLLGIGVVAIIVTLLGSVSLAMLTSPAIKMLHHNITNATAVMCVVECLVGLPFLRRRKSRQPSSHH